jgi:hypothetical protein
MTEKNEAILLANKILDRVRGDPDDDLAVLARQFLRALERLGEYRPDAEQERNAARREPRQTPLFGDF